MNKSILLIDADSSIPNIALMKLSTYWKQQGYNVLLKQCNLSYYPTKKSIFIFDDNYYKKYCSIIFDTNKEYIKGENIVYGGTGVDLKTVLPEEIENLDCDYSLYPDNNISYGFITRGCIRNCYFCKVPKKEGYIRQVNTIDNIVKHKKVKFLDNNILAFDGHKDILQELIDKKIKHQFNQALDIRLVTETNSLLLSQLNYFGEYSFAFDDIKLKNILLEKLNIMCWRKAWQFKFFVYVHPTMSIFETVERIELLKELKCLPYIMRDISCWESTYSDFYVDIAAYCNQPNIFKKMSFNEFLDRRHTNKDRIIQNKNIYNKGINNATQ